MPRAVLVLHTDAIRRKAHAWIDGAPQDSRVEFSAPKRTLPQNALLWARLTDIATQVKWHGLKLSPDDWKLIFMDALKSEMRIVPNIDGDGFVNIGRSSSKLSKEEFGDLLTLLEKFGAEHGVVFHDREEA